jgi:hypothetical protein
VLADGTIDKDGRDHRRGRQAIVNAVKRQGVGQLRFGGEAWLRRLQMRRSKINNENKSFVHCHCNSKSILVICVFFLYMNFSSITYAKSTQEPFRAIAITYVNLALANSQHRIVKPDGNRPLTFWLSCLSRESSKCSKSTIQKKTSSAIAQNDNVRIKFQEFDPLIFVEFADEYVVKFKRTELNKKYENMFTDSADLDCGLYYEVNNSIISRVVILISLDSSDHKQRMCLANQFYQGLGLPLPEHKPFSELWKSNVLPFSKMTDSDFDRLVRSYSIFTYLHLCSKILNGMDKHAVNLELRNQDCWTGLFLK